MLENHMVLGEYQPALDENLCQQVIEEEAEREMDDGKPAFMDWLREEASEQVEQVVFAALRILTSSNPMEERLADVALYANRLQDDYIAYRRETMDDDLVAELVAEKME
jgi:hypothetical protein